jgi:chromatin assembly factor 1 subunit B
MKVETPQVRWHADDKGKNQALLGVSMLPNNDDGKSPRILATAGNTVSIHLWKLHTSHNKTSFEFLTSLNRHESSVNALSFSPDGLHLASASDTGSVIVWSVPVQMRGNHNGRHYWSQVTKETDLKVNIVPRNGDGITDLSWSQDSKRFVLGTIDNTVLVCEDAHYHDIAQESSWKCVHRNSMDHSHFVQGVAYDPQGVYLASMSSDRTVRIHMRKSPGSSKTKKKKVLRTVTLTANSSSAVAALTTHANNIPPLAHQTMVASLLTNSKLEMCTKSKLIKYRRGNCALHPSSASSSTDDGTTTEQHTISPKPARQALFADESTLQSFVRRLAWTPDGAFLITPAVMWQTGLSDSSPQFATCLWSRHNYEEPARVLLGMEKVCVCCDCVAE